MAANDAMKRREFLRYAAGGVLVTTVGVVGSMSPAWAQSEWKKADRGPLKQWPVLSLRERDRRWNAARRIMEENNVELLYVPNNLGDNFFTNDADSAIFFPLQGNPIALAGDRSFQSVGWLTNEERGEVSWVRDWRFTNRERVFPLPPPVEIEIIREMGFDKTRIGTVGVTRGSGGDSSGRISYTLWTALQKELKGVTWVDLTEPFVTEWLTKSEEDLVFFRKAALLAEISSEAVMEASKPGASEADIYHAAMHEVLYNGGVMSNVNLQSGPDNASGGTPKWRQRTQKPRAIQSGDIITTQLFPRCAHLTAQAQMCVAVGKVADIHRKLARIARESYEIGVKAIKPGVKLSEVAAAMNQPNIREGAWHTTANVFSLNPDSVSGPRTEGIRNFPALVQRFPHITERSRMGMDLVLREGMCFQLAPNSCIGRNRVSIGGNVIVTKNGCEELNKLSCEMRVVG